MNFTTIVAVGTALYFFGFGAGFLARPELADRLGLRWTNPAGRTEIRCYYGAVSWALGGYLIYLVTQDEAAYAVTAALFLASAVFVTRVIGTVIDGASGEAYTRLAIPTEAAFVAVLAAARLLA
ncbi:MAG: DUF4345 family protein [Aquihabitans sp.]